MTVFRRKLGTKVHLSSPEITVNLLNAEQTNDAL